ncbi:hypothetical protein PACTADRAFT_43167, partial [Pachysolen tannophilus NRRL Y-2460]
AAIVIPQADGENKSQVPTGFSRRISSAYGIHLSGNFETIGPKFTNAVSFAFFKSSGKN